MKGGAREKDHPRGSRKACLFFGKRLLRRDRLRKWVPRRLSFHFLLVKKKVRFVPANWFQRYCLLPSCAQRGGTPLEERKKEKIGYGTIVWLLLGVDFRGERLVGLGGCSLDPALGGVEPG